MLLSDGCDGAWKIDRYKLSWHQKIWQDNHFTRATLDATGEGNGEGRLGVVEVAHLYDRYGSCRAHPFGKVRERFARTT